VKTDELRELPSSELRKHLDETQEELFNLRFQGATGQLENFKRLGVMRREIARTRTVMRERELGIVRDVLGGEGEADEEGSARRLLRRKRAHKEASGGKDEE
jgi:large subunit ribosomal protein L29